MGFQSFIEEIQVLGRDLVESVRALIHEGNVRRIIIKDERGHIFMEIPVTFAAIGIIAAPVLAAVGAISVKSFAQADSLQSDGWPMQQRRQGLHLRLVAIAQAWAGIFSTGCCP